ncbi:MAG: hypothetical protein ACHQ5A_03555 [Opitutales bacterium]
MKVRLVLLLASFVLPLAVLRADSQTDEWIARGRAALGTEKALSAINSVHFSGLLETTEPKQGKDGKIIQVPLKLTIDIVFQRPYQQRITLRSEKIVETTGLDDYDGWKRRAEVGDESKWELSLLDPIQIKHLRANTWENLSFYRGIEQRGGRVEFQGEETVDSRPCVKLAFIHADNIIFTRFFDRATGRLIKTVTENGGEIREEGETLINGVRFPLKLINKDSTGLLTTITFSSVKVNESIPASEFAVPALGHP